MQIGTLARGTRPASLEGISHIWQDVQQRLFAPASIRVLIYFRVAFGILMLWQVWRYFDHGWIERYYMEPEFYFTYYGFDWIHPWSGNGVVLHFYAMAVLAICMTLGLFYRLSMTLFFLAFTYVFLLDQTNYLNHYYLVALISFLLIFVPAHRGFSIDVWWRPHLRSEAMPTWTLWMLRLQLAIVYFYAGIAKLNQDWLEGQPMRMWLASRTDFPIIGRFFTDDWMVYLLSYGGMLFDLLIIPLILWRRTRWFAITSSLIFHLTNYQLFNIGVFPWFMLAALPLFLPPDWFAKIKLPFAQATEQAPSSDRFYLHSHRRLILVLLAAYFAVQLAIPLRHHLYPGNVNWTEEGHRLSWRMKLRSKEADILQFFVINKGTGIIYEVNEYDLLAPRQVDEMSGRPDMLLQFCHYLAKLESERTGTQIEQVEIRTYVTVSLNGRSPRLLVNPATNMTQQPRNLKHAGWIMPFPDDQSEEE